MGRAIIAASTPAPPDAGIRGVPEGGATSTPAADIYSDKVIKLVPGEVISLYLSMVALLGASADPVADIVPWVVFGFGAAATWAYLRLTLKVSDWRQLALTVGAFCVWAFALGEPFESLNWYNGTYAGIALAAYTFMAPMVPVGQKV